MDWSCLADKGAAGKGAFKVLGRANSPRRVSPT